MVFGNDASGEDRVLLSAYIDDELPPAQQKALEARLSQDPVLRRELEELRTVVQAVRALPPLTAPRDFTLTPDMLAGEPDAPLRKTVPFPLNTRLSTLLSAVSGAAAALLIGVGMFLLLVSAELQSERAAVMPMSAELEIAERPTERPTQVDDVAQSSAADIDEALADDDVADADFAPQIQDSELPTRERDDIASSNAAGSAEMAQEAEEVEEPADEDAADGAEFSPPIQNRQLPPPDADDAVEAGEADDAAGAALSEPIAPLGLTEQVQVFETQVVVENSAATMEQFQIEADEMLDALDDDVSVSVITSEPTLQAQVIVSPATASAVPEVGQITASESSDTSSPEAVTRPATDSRWIGFSLIGLGVALAGVSAGIMIVRRRRHGQE